MGGHHDDGAVHRTAHDEMAYPAGIYDYYGCTPYWGAGYVSPLHPGRII